MQFDEDFVVIRSAAGRSGDGAEAQRGRWIWRPHDLCGRVRWCGIFCVRGSKRASLSSPLFTLACPSAISIFPTIDPLADKNRDLELEYVRACSKVSASIRRGPSSRKFRL